MANAVMLQKGSWCSHCSLENHAEWDKTNLRSNGSQLWGPEAPLEMWGKSSLQGHAYMHIPTKGGVLLPDVTVLSSCLNLWCVLGKGCWGTANPWRPCASLEFLLIAPLWGQGQSFPLPSKQPSAWQAKEWKNLCPIAQHVRRGLLLIKGKYCFQPLVNMGNFLTHQYPPYSSSEWTGLKNFSQ